MLIKSEFDIQFYFAHSTAMVAMLHLHPSLERFVRTGNVLVVEHLKEGVRPGYGELIGTLEYSDSFGNRCSRFVAPQGLLRPEPRLPAQPESPALPGPRACPSCPLPCRPWVLSSFWGLPRSPGRW